MRAETLPAPQAPEISILMTAFNTEKYLDEAIDSVLAQNTQRTWELLLVDDGSTDGTLAIAKRYERRLGYTMQVLQHPGGRNRGISASRNLALSRARGKLLAFLDSDDVWLPFHLETQARLLDIMPSVTMVYAEAERWFDFTEPFDEQSSRRASWGDNCLPPIVPSGQSTGLLPQGELLHWFRRDESLVPCICTVLVRTEAAREVGGFCNELRGLYDDQAFHAKIITNYGVYANHICTARYRQHKESCCGRSRRDTRIQQQEEKRFLSFLSSYTSHATSGNPESKLTRS